MWEINLLIFHKTKCGDHSEYSLKHNSRVITLVVILNSYSVRFRIVVFLNFHKTTCKCGGHSEYSLKHNSRVITVVVLLVTA